VSSEFLRDVFLRLVRLGIGNVNVDDNLDLGFWSGVWNHLLKPGSI